MEPFFIKMASHPQNKTVFPGCTAIIVAVVSLALGAMLVLIEFGMAFCTSTSDRVSHTVVSILLWTLNPIGMIGWVLAYKKTISNDFACLIFFGGVCISAVCWDYLLRRIIKVRASK